MENPYKALEPSSFWKPAISAVAPLEVNGLWAPKFSIDKKDGIFTAGSCFAQHIGKALQAGGYNWRNYEEGPGPAALDRKYGYGIFSFRTGNIYTPSLLRQWVELAFGDPKDDVQEVWVSKNGRFFDPLRPAIEPNGFGSKEELIGARARVLRAIKDAVTGGDIFVFTLGLTEAWKNSESGMFYAMCPGTLAGEFDESRHIFVNIDYEKTRNDLKWVVDKVLEINPGMRFLLTVSPVPLTATAGGKHVLVATTYSKSVLRAVAGAVADEYDCVDYFPSYEIITSPIYRGIFFEGNMREVSSRGVAFVMEHFFKGLGSTHGSSVDERNSAASSSEPVNSNSDVVCEEALLEVFGGEK